jgi:hypothetical protein
MDFMFNMECNFVVDDERNRNMSLDVYLKI